MESHSIASQHLLQSSGEPWDFEGITEGPWRSHVLAGDCVYSIRELWYHVRLKTGYLLPNVLCGKGTCLWEEPCARSKWSCEIFGVVNSLNCAPFAIESLVPKLMTENQPDVD